MTLPLHRKYRPEDFDQMYGNESMLESLASVVQKEDKPSTYLLHGPSGCGKTTLARIISEYLGCRKPKEYNISDTRGIDAARSIIEKVWYHTFGVGRVIILNECHMATKEFQNAMLEVLEEPPPDTYFILCTTEPEKLLKTILTRCTQFQVRPLNRPDMIDLLKTVAEEEEKELKKEVLSLIVKTSEGSPRTALTMLNRLIDLDEDAIDEVVHEVMTTEAEVYALFKLLIKGAKWKTVGKTITVLKADPEQARYQMIGLLSGALLRSEDPRIAWMLGCFTETNFMYSKRAGLVYACYQSLNPKESIETVLAKMLAE